MPESKQELISVPSYDNWLAFLSGRPLLRSYECILHTDARVSGEVFDGIGPYQFLNLVSAEQEKNRVHASIVLRVNIHIEFDVPKTFPKKSEQARYHGGNLDDEIAALSSLTCGVRFKAGAPIRRFDRNDDPKGRPIAWSVRPTPTLLSNSYGSVLPNVKGFHAIDEIGILDKFPKLTSRQAIALIRVARLYQDALWLADSDPSLTWLLLTSAIETAANEWCSSSDYPIERLRISKPEFAQIDWTKDGFQKVFRLIYHYRSKALHDGMPFPAPMCEFPVQMKGWKAYSEKLLGLATYSLNGIWLAKDTPILLNTFEYIVRCAIKKWWLSMCKS